MISSTAFASLALSWAASQAPLAAAFSSQACPKTHRISSSSELRYRSLHHGPDVEPLSDMEKQGAVATKMDKDKIMHYGPGDFSQYEESSSSDLFDGGDSEMGLSGDGQYLRKIGRDTSPHMARAASTSYADELMFGNPNMDAARAQQLENWAMQKEIHISNKYAYGGSEVNHGNYEYGDIYYEDDTMFAYPIEAGENIDGLITLTAAVNQVAAHNIMLKNEYMGFAKFRAGFVGNESNEWSVAPSDGYLKQSEPTNFLLTYNPHSHGSSTAYFVVETEDFKKTWKVVGSTGEYEF
jgi:hypothetical protein